MQDLLAGVSPAELALIWLFTAAATVLRAFTGFGFALAAVPAFGLFLLPTEAVVLSAGLALLLGIYSLPRYYTHARAHSDWTLYLSGLIATIIGAQLLARLDTSAFQVGVGLLTVIASLVLLSFQPRPQRVGRGLHGLTGTASGLMNGAFAIPGPPVILLVMATQRDPIISRAILMAFFTFSSLIALASYASLGYLSVKILVLIGLAYPATIVGDKVGMQLFNHFGSKHYRLVAVIVMIGLGLSITFRGVTG